MQVSDDLTFRRSPVELAVGGGRMTSIRINSSLLSLASDPVGLGMETTLGKVLNALLTPIVGLLPPMDSGPRRQLLQEARAAAPG